MAQTQTATPGKNGNPGGPDEVLYADWGTAGLPAEGPVALKIGTAELQEGGGGDYSYERIHVTGNIIARNGTPLAKAEPFYGNVNIGGPKVKNFKSLMKAAGITVTGPVTRRDRDAMIAGLQGRTVVFQLGHYEVPESGEIVATFGWVFAKSFEDLAKATSRSRSRR